MPDHYPGTVPMQVLPIVCEAKLGLPLGCMGGVGTWKTGAQRVGLLLCLWWAVAACSIMSPERKDPWALVRVGMTAVEVHDLLGQPSATYSTAISATRVLDLFGPSAWVAYEGINGPPRVVEWGNEGVRYGIESRDAECPVQNGR